MNPIITTCTIWHHRDGGRYYKFPRLFQKKRPTIDKWQFAGLVGDPPRPVFTVARPVDVKSVLSLAWLNTVISNEPIVWLGGVKCYKVGNGLKYYLPTNLHPFFGGVEIPYAVMCAAETKAGPGIPVIVLRTKGRIPYVEGTLSSGSN